MSVILERSVTTNGLITQTNIDTNSADQNQNVQTFNLCQNKRRKIKLLFKEKNSTRKKKKRVGKGFVNTLINKLPFEMHIPSHHYCGPGTKLKERLARNDPGINELDRACRAHDIAYSITNDQRKRNRAGEVLANVWLHLV